MMVSHDLHMQQTCSTCGFHDYDKKQTESGTTPYGKFCILEDCLASVRTDDFSLNTAITLVPPLYEIQPATPFLNMNKGFLTSLSDTADKTNLRAFDTSLTTTTLPWWTDSQSQETVYNEPDFDESMQGSATSGVDRVYVSFVDFFFRILMQRIKNTIQTDEINEITSVWDDVDSDGYYDKNRQIVGKYNDLFENYENMQGDVEFQDSLPSVETCSTPGARHTTLKFSVPVGEEFQFQAIISFADEPLSSADCEQGDQDCLGLFAHDSNYLTFNNTNSEIIFADLSRFILENITFNIHSATGYNKIALVMQHSQNHGVLETTILNADVHWSRGDLRYTICNKSDSVGKHAVITDPWAFSKIKHTFHNTMCQNVNYA